MLQLKYITGLCSFVAGGRRADDGSFAIILSVVLLSKWDALIYTTCVFVSFYQWPISSH